MLSPVDMTSVKSQDSLIFSDDKANFYLAVRYRMNQEFRKFFQDFEYVPILRNVRTNHYWINENYSEVELDSNSMNIVNPIIRIIVTYIDAKRKSFEEFFQTCWKMQSIQGKDAEQVQEYV